jgi:photosystem II stability/assembly factor-like uncharacterized protein
MKQRNIFLNWVIRISLFSLILTLGTVATLVVDERQGLAMTDLSNAPIQNLTTVTQAEATLYASVTGDSSGTRLYRSTDKGITWLAIGAAPLASLNALAVHPVNDRILFAGTVGGPVATTNNLWRSEDSGQTWHKLFLSLPANPDGVIPAVTALATDPNQPGALYVGTAGQGVYRFDVGTDGQGYTLVGNVSLHDAYIKGLVINANSQVYALTQDGLFVNGGGNWRQIDTPSLPISLAVAATNPDILYAGTPSSGVYRSTDGGKNWTPLNAGLGLVPGVSLRVTALTVDKQNPQHVVVATAYGLGHELAPGAVYESYDGGDQWFKLGESDHLVQTLSLNDGLVYAATAHGLVRYSEAAASADAITPLLPLQTLAQPTGLQLTILAVTLALAGLALLGRVEWVRRQVR